MLAVLGGALVLAAGIGLLTAGGDRSTMGSPSGGSQPAATAQAAEPSSPYGKPTPTPLPPETRVVGFAGGPQHHALGILGTMPLAKAADRLARQSRPYERKSRPVLGAFDLIATMADAHPGPAGLYRTRLAPDVIARYLRAARREDVALILDVQPGGSNFPDEVRALRHWLKEPDVHLALDPEWRMRPGVRPGSRIGWVSAGELEHTLADVAATVRRYNLPQKLVLVHRFTDGMIHNLDRVRVPKEIVPIISVDGVGSRALKQATYRRLAPNLPKPWLPGFKVFYEEDAEAGGRMSGEQVMALQPRPHVVLYE